MSGDFVTIDYAGRPHGGVRAWQRAWGAAQERGVPGLRHALVARRNLGTGKHAIPRLEPRARMLVLAWESAEAAHDAWTGMLAPLSPAADRFALDLEVVRVRSDHEGRAGGAHWHGWSPSAADARPIEAEEPVVAVIHGMLRYRGLLPFIRGNRHASRRLATHPGVRANTAMNVDLVRESTSLSCWSTAAQMRDYAYADGGHADAMRAGRAADWHDTTLFLQCRPLAATGALGRTGAAFPELPPARRGR